MLGLEAFLTRQRLSGLPPRTFTPSTDFITFNGQEVNQPILVGVMELKPTAVITSFVLSRLTEKTDIDCLNFSQKKSGHQCLLFKNGIFLIINFFEKDQSLVL